MIMDCPLFSVFFALVFLSGLSFAKDSAPKVQIYTRDPGHFNKPNILICHASGFYPPEVELELLHDGQSIPGAEQTDLAFEENWFYHLTKHVKFQPEKGHMYSCSVTHKGVTKTFHWEPDM